MQTADKSFSNFLVSCFATFNMNKICLKRSESVILSAPPCKEGKTQFTMVPLKPKSNQKCERFLRCSLLARNT